MFALQPAEADITAAPSRCDLGETPRRKLGPSVLLGRADCFRTVSFRLHPFLLHRFRAVVSGLYHWNVLQAEGIGLY